MKHHENVKIVAFVGLTGSGKSSAVEYLTNKGYPKVYFGGVIYQAMEAAGIVRTAESETKFREEIREQEGKDFVVNRIVKQIRDLIDAGQHRIIADGIYTWTEYKIMKREFPGELTVVAVVTPKHLRHHRLTTRPERPYTLAEADKRDWAEIENLEKGGPIAIADHYIMNNGNIDHFHQQIDDELDHIKFYS
jgi:dephospho-CoA kinase